jgi:hypothetical protein
MFQPYTYYLYHIPTGLKYYGVRLSPLDEPYRDLWTLYFGSSDVVDLIRQYFGNDSFRVEVRKIFDTKQEAFEWEQSVLKKLNVMGRTDWINRGYGGRWKYVYPMSEKQRNNIRKSKLGKKRGPLSEEWKRNISLANLGRKDSEETKERKRKMYHGLGMTGKHHKEESKIKIRNSNIGKHSGKPPWNKGVPQTEEQRKRNSESKLGRKAWNKGQKMSAAYVEQCRIRSLGKKRGPYKKRITTP